ncbi:MAG TPA: tetratricopeptide repeat protein, partial [Gemmatimonadaceae bacterium]|nr:tetratricopeptide repeat protein [Gemmatimonadaceae bacterium]
EAQERALEENLAFAPAHVAMGQLAAARGDTGAAATEFGLAVELSPADGAMRYWYGVALVKAQRGADAVAQLTEAVRLEPYFADGYLALGDARALAGDGAKAAAAYAEFLKRAPRSESANIDRAKRRLAELGAPSP